MSHEWMARRRVLTTSRGLAATTLFSRSQFMGPKTVAQSFGVRAQIGPNEKSDRRWFVRRPPGPRMDRTLPSSPRQPCAPSPFPRLPRGKLVNFDTFFDTFVAYARVRRRARIRSKSS